MASAQAGPINSTESGPGLEMAGSRGSVGATNGMRGQVTDTMMKEQFNDSSKGGSDLNMHPQTQALSGVAQHNTASRGGLIDIQTNSQMRGS